MRRAPARRGRPTSARPAASSALPDGWEQTGRNQPCPCGSGKKFKHCHGALTRASCASGVLFVATGAGYRTLAARAAASVARVSPGLPIDLATDEPVEPGDFAEVTVLDDPWFRSRIDAMARDPLRAHAAPRRRRAGRRRPPRRLRGARPLRHRAGPRPGAATAPPPTRSGAGRCRPPSRSSTAASSPTAAPRAVLDFLRRWAEAMRADRHEEGPAVAARAALGERPPHRHAAARVQPPRPRRHPPLGPLPPGAAARSTTTASTSISPAAAARSRPSRTCSAR